ncbi:MAG TPA: oligosaccharide flippase family protein [Oscillospiraceae bacterium]|jgi:O-antigen/teichoic acid export membrane protein|nr:oligosaccharide flippase family protein [Oscillospiraceae bacterium]
MDKYKKLASNTIIFAIGTFSSKVLSFLLMPFVTRMMGTGDYGAADLVQQTVNVLIPIVTLQVNSAALRFALDKATNKADVFKVGVRTTFAGFAVFLLFTYPLSMLTINDFRLGDYIILIIAFVLVSSLRQLCQQFVRGSGHVKLYALDGILATATTLAFTILFLGPFKWGVTGYIVAIIASDACSVVFYFAAAKLYRYLRFNKLKDKGIAFQMLKYCVPLIPTVVLWWIINVSDRYMVTYFISSSANGLYTAASKIPNFVILFSQIFIDAWQLSAVDEYDQEGGAHFFTKVFRAYSGGVFAVASVLIFMCQIITRILVAKDYYESWQFVPILIIATTYSCIVNFLASVYMAKKKSLMSLVTAMSGAVTNFVLNLVFIPRMGANGAALATVCAFLVVFVTRGIDTRRYIKIDFKLPVLLSETAVLVSQSVLLLKFGNTLWIYGVEAVLVVVMILLNLKPIKELVNLLLAKFIKKKKS